MTDDACKQKWDAREQALNHLLKLANEIRPPTPIWERKPAPLREAIEEYDKRSKDYFDCKEEHREEEGK